MLLVWLTVKQVTSRYSVFRFSDTICVIEMRNPTEQTPLIQNAPLNRSVRSCVNACCGTTNALTSLTTIVALIYILVIYLSIMNNDQFILANGVSTRTEMEKITDGPNTKCQHPIEYNLAAVTEPSMMIRNTSNTIEYSKGAIPIQDTKCDCCLNWFYVKNNTCSWNDPYMKGHNVQIRFVTPNVDTALFGMGGWYSSVITQQIVVVLFTLLTIFILFVFWIDDYAIDIFENNLGFVDIRENWCIVRIILNASHKTEREHPFYFYYLRITHVYAFIGGIMPLLTWKFSQHCIVGRKLALLENLGINFTFQMAEEINTAYIVVLFLSVLFWFCNKCCNIDCSKRILMFAFVAFWIPGVLFSTLLALVLTVNDDIMDQYFETASITLLAALISWLTHIPHFVYHLFNKIRRN